MYEPKNHDKGEARRDREKGEQRCKTVTKGAGLGEERGGDNRDTVFPASQS